MNFVISPGARTGAVRIPASKSQAHRLLICAALGKAPVTVRCDGLNADILATAACLRALGANIAEQDGALHVEPVKAVPDGLCILPCGESGSTLRFLLPVVGALGADAVFLREGRLPERPLEPLLSELVRGGMMFRSEDGKLFYSRRENIRSPEIFPRSTFPRCFSRCRALPGTARSRSPARGRARAISP